MSGSIVLACDVYGTFLDTSSVATALQKNLGILDSITSSKAKEIAQAWRKYQLEYTWRLNSMGKYEPFDAVTRKSLLHAARDSGSTLSADAVEKVMAFYHALPTFDDAAPAWHDLNEVQGVDCWIFSNGAQEMVTSALRAASLESPKAFLIAPDVQKYKPAPEIYRALLSKAGKEGTPQDVYLLSSNPFDVVGARACGLSAIWVDRSGSGWSDQLGMGLGPGGRELAPTKIVKGLGEVAEYVRSLKGSG